MDDALRARTARLKFRRPPVSDVFLTLYFEADSHIQGSHVAPLKMSWESELPLVQELAPLPGEMDSDGPTFLASGGQWPLPYTRYNSVSSDQAIAFQGDRFQLQWSFSDAAGDEYPGFEKLSEGLEKRYVEFKNVLDQAGIILTIRGSECKYVNRIQGLSAGEVAVGVLTEWRGVPGSNLPKEGYVGVRLHACASEEKHRCSSFLQVDGDTGDSAHMTINVSRELDDEEKATLGGLYDAHDELLDIFERFTSPEMHGQWEREL